MGFQGTLNEPVGLAEIFQLLGDNKCTGELCLTSPYMAQRGRIYFNSGNPVNAVFNGHKGLDAVYALFGVTEGQFEYTGNAHQAVQQIKANNMQIVLEAMRKLDDGEINAIGPPQASKIDQIQAPEILLGPEVDFMHIINEDSYRQGDIITREGASHGNWIWLILDGTVEVRKETEKGSLVISKLGQGSFIGDLSSLVGGSASRSATITALKDVHLGVVDNLRLTTEFSSLSLEFRKILLSGSNRMAKVTNRAVDAFVGDKTIDDKVKGKHPLSVKGDRQLDAYQVVAGNVLVVGRSQKGHKPLFVLGKDDYIGYLPFMQTGHEPAGASLLATEDLKVKKLDPDALRNEYEGLSSTMKNMVENLNAYIAATTNLVYSLL